MPSYWVYSVEALPRTDLFGKRDYNPAQDYIAYNGIYLPPLPAETWTAIPDRFKSLRHHDRTDRQGHTYHVFADEIVKANENRLRPRGVVFLDHEPTAAERKPLEVEAAKLNMQFRLDCIQQYEDTLKEAEANGRTAKAGTYVQECYDQLGMARPGSVEALRAQRQPGEDAAIRFAAAIEKLIAHLTPKAEVPSAPAKVAKSAGPAPAGA